MQVHSILTIAAILFLGFVRSTAATTTRDGNQLLSACTHAIRITDSPQALRQPFREPDIALEAGYCIGFLSGVANMNIFWQTRTKDTSMFFCLPPEGIINQLMRVVVKYLQEHPEKLHDPDIAVASMALANAFPCPSKIQSPRR